MKQKIIVSIHFHRSPPQNNVLLQARILSVPPPQKGGDIITFTSFPISLLGEGKTVPVPPVRFCTRFQRFTVPTVHRLFDFLRFGSTVPVRFLNLTVLNEKYILLHKTGRLSKKRAPLSETRHLYPELIQYIM